MHRPTRRFPELTAGAALEASVLVALLGVSLLAWLERIGLSPDSTNYMVAAQNLLAHGEWFVWANWPSDAVEPGREPYTEYPAGFPLYLAFFLAVLRDTVSSLLMAQAVAVAICYGALAWVMHRVGLPRVLRIAGYLFLTFSTTFRLIFTHLWTEALFTGLSLLAGGCALSLLLEPAGSHRGSSGSRDPGGPSSVGARARRRLWALGLLFVVLSGTVKFIGLFNVAWFALPLLRDGSRPLRRAALVLAAGFAPVVLWLGLNRWMFGRVSLSHFQGRGLLRQNLWDPFLFLWQDLLAVRFVPGGALIGLVAVTLLFTVPAVRLLARVRSGSPEAPASGGSAAARGEAAWGAEGDGSERDARDEPAPVVVRLLQHLSLVGVSLGFFFGVWALSLVARFDPVDGRLLSVAIAVGLVAALNGLHLIAREAGDRRVRAAILALPFALLPLSDHMVWEIEAPARWSEVGLVEEELWEAIDARGLGAGATHFYSEMHFTHQLFAGRPQMILWTPNELESAESVEYLANRGTRPFFLFREGSPELAAFRGQEELLERRFREHRLEEFGFVLFEQVENPPAMPQASDVQSFLDRAREAA